MAILVLYHFYHFEFVSTIFLLDFETASTVWAPPPPPPPYIFITIILQVNVHLYLYYYCNIKIYIFRVYYSLVFKNKIKFTKIR